MFINNFDPVAIQFLSIEIRWYSLSYIIGILIGWIAGKLGFENFAEMLEGFSFADGIQSIFIKIAEVFNKAISFVTDSVGAIGRKVASFFGFGGDKDTKSLIEEIIKTLMNTVSLTHDDSMSLNC